jgi:hypothetical protein
MGPHEVTIEFRGICTHFSNTVPGIAHRVVLPQADGVLLGLIDVGGQLTPYGLPPHACYIYSCSPNAVPIDGPGIVLGWIVAGVRLQIANAIRSENIDHLGLGRIPRLREFAFNYRYSNDVVLGGRARCYFDLSHGSVGVGEQGKALHGVAVVATDGPPCLRIEPFAGGPPLEVRVGPRLIVGNSSLCCKDASLDFLLHLLTAEGGIPQQLPREPYGFAPGKAVASPKRLIKCVGDLLDLEYPGHLTKSAEEVFGDLNETDPSCSNSQWP